MQWIAYITVIPRKTVPFGQILKKNFLFWGKSIQYAAYLCTTLHSVHQNAEPKFSVM